MADRDTIDLGGTTLGILGGTGALGRGLARRFAASGLAVLLGSRSAERAAEAAAGLDGDVRGVDNRACAAQADLVVVAVPWEGHGELLTDLAEVLAGKVVVDCVNPLGFDDHGPYALDVPDGSACEQAQRLLPDSRVVGAFHHLSAPELLGGEDLDADVLVVGDDRDAVETVVALAQRMPGVRGIAAGRLRDAHQVEALTANIIAVNRRYRTRASLRVTGL